MASALLFLESGWPSHLQREEGKGLPWPLPFSSWEVEECEMVTPISPPEGSKEGVSMASTLLSLSLEGGGVWPVSLPSHLEGSREGVTMASTLLFLGSGWVVIIARRPTGNRRSSTAWTPRERAL